jgi:predicted protein tyrosine phosphatase
VRALFVCTANVSRSRAAAEVFSILTWNVGGGMAHEARSAGIRPDADGRPLTHDDLAWADVVCAMETEHEAFIRERWPVHATKVRVLGIPDVYMPDDPDLKDLLARHILALLADPAA